MKKILKILTPDDEAKLNKEAVDGIVKHHKLLFDVALANGFSRSEAMEILKMQAAYDLRPTHPFPSEDFDCDCDDCEDCR